MAENEKRRLPKDLRYRNEFFPDAEDLVFDTKRKGFIPLPIILRKMLLHITPPELRAYIYLALRASKFGICYPSMNDFYRDLGLTGPKNLTPHLQGLVEKQMISMHEAMGKTFFLVHDPRVALKHRFDKGQIGGDELFEIEELLNDLHQDPLVPKEKPKEEEKEAAPSKKRRAAKKKSKKNPA